MKKRVISVWNLHTKLKRSSKTKIKINAPLLSDNIYVSTSKRSKKNGLSNKKKHYSVLIPNRRRAS